MGSTSQWRWLLQGPLSKPQNRGPSNVPANSFSLPHIQKADVRHPASGCLWLRWGQSSRNLVGRKLLILGPQECLSRVAPARIRYKVAAAEGQTDSSTCRDARFQKWLCPTAATPVTSPERYLMTREYKDETHKKKGGRGRCRLTKEKMNQRTSLEN